MSLGKNISGSRSQRRPTAAQATSPAATVEITPNNNPSIHNNKHTKWHYVQINHHLANSG